MLLNIFDALEKQLEVVYSKLDRLEREINHLDRKISILESFYNDMTHNSASELEICLQTPPEGFNNRKRNKGAIL